MTKSVYHTASPLILTEVADGHEFGYGENDFYLSVTSKRPDDLAADHPDCDMYFILRHHEDATLVAITDAMWAMIAHCNEMEYAVHPVH